MTTIRPVRRTIRAGIVLVVIGALLASGCGSSTGQSKQATSLCGVMVPALRHTQQVVNQVAAYAQGTSQKPVSNAQIEDFITTLIQAYTKAASLVPADRRSSFESQADIFRQGQRLLNQKGTTADAALNQLGQLTQPHAAAFDANNAYIVQRCGGRQAVYGSTQSSS